MLESALWVVHVIAAVCMVGLVLMQHGKGADVGAAFGSGSAGSLFGATGAANFLSRTTAVVAAVFFATSLSLTYFSNHAKTRGSVMQGQKIEPKQAVSAAPAKQQDSVAPAPPAVPADSKAKDIPK